MSDTKNPAVALPCPGGPFGTQPGAKPGLATETSLGRSDQLEQQRVVDDAARGKPASYQPGAYRRLGSDLGS